MKNVIEIQGSDPTRHKGWATDEHKQHRKCTRVLPRSSVTWLKAREDCQFLNLDENKGEKPSIKRELILNRSADGNSRLPAKPLWFINPW